MKLLKKKQKQLQQFLMKKMKPVKKKICILLSFFALLIAVSIYCYLIKYKAKTYINILRHKITN